tara:strand:- start:163 stop:279 length:117 start_codon:yes stop_codon:yes gene_type:complete
VIDEIILTKKAEMIKELSSKINSSVFIPMVLNIFIVSE